MIDLSTTYMGLKLENPLVASASPLCEKIDNIRKMEEAGASAVVLHSLFEEQINREGLELDRFLTQGTESYGEMITYFPDLGNYKIGPDDYLEHIRKAKSAVKIPVIASLNGVSTGGWISYAKLMEEAGADGLELNMYYIPADMNLTSQQIEQMYIDLARDVKKSLSIPVAVKLSPYFSSMSYMAQQLDQTGIGALVLFNRFYQPDIDIENLKVNPNLVLSTSDELRLRLRWVAILYGRIKSDMAITGGIHTAQDALKAMMVGSKVAMMTSAILKNGIQHIAKVKDDMVKWMDEHKYDSISQMQGSMSQKSVAEPTAFERANYMKMLNSYSR